MPIVPDFWGVWPRREALRARAREPLFAEWRARFLDGLQTALAGPPDAPGEGAARITALARAAEEMGFGTLLTGEEAYALRALELLERLRADPSPWVIADHSGMYPADPADLLTAESVKACATALSWVEPVAGADATRALIAHVAERGGRAIYEGCERGCWWATALNSNWTAVLNSGLGFAALLLRESDPQTAGRWLRFARPRTVEWLALAAAGAAGVEGAGYWLYCFGSLQDLVEALRNVDGDDLYAHPFWEKCSRFLPYVALPDLSAWANYADTGYRGLGGSAFFHGVAARKQDPLAQGFANAILRRHGGAGWKNVLFHDPAVPEKAFDGEPACRFFESIHLASFRSGWDKDAVFLLFKGGSNAWSHTHLDLNSFYITGYGERLATEPGPAPYSIHYWHSIEPAVSTAWHNCIVVDGGHQRVAAQYAMTYDLEEAGDCYSRLSDPLSAPGIEMIRGDATTAYADALERAWRDVVYLKPNVFVLFDDLEARPARVQRNFEWMLHSECPLSDVPGGIEARGEKARLLIQPIFPEGWEHKYVAGKTVPGAGNKPLHCVSVRPYWHHKWNVDPRRSAYPHWDPRGGPEPLYENACRYLVVLSVLPAGAPPRFAVEGYAEGSVRGVRLTSAEETAVVLFNREGRLLEMGDLATDAEKVVLRERDGRLSWVAARATMLTWCGRELMAAAHPTTQAGGAG